jgi:hypothetical protein
MTTELLRRADRADRIADQTVDEKAGETRRDAARQHWAEAQQNVRAGSRLEVPKEIS